MKRVLTVEDRGIGSGLLTSYTNEIKELVGDEVEFTVVTNFDDAQKVCALAPFSFDCATVDMRIPAVPESMQTGRDLEHHSWGLKALKEVERHLPLARLIILTGHLDDVAPYLTKDEMKRVREKPIHADDFVEELANMLRIP